MLTYTLERLLTQQAVFQRNEAVPDAYGAQSTPVWEPHLTVPCLLWWDRSSGVRSANREFVTAQREVPLSQGGLILASGTDVTQEDRVAQINMLDNETEEWVVMVQGVFEIVGVVTQQTHLEVSLIRTSLGP